MTNLGDVVGQISSVLGQGIDQHEAVTMNMKHCGFPDQGQPTSSTSSRSSVPPYFTTLGKRVTWVGLKRDRLEQLDGTPVRQLPQGDVDGGTWRLLLRS